MEEITVQDILNHYHIKLKEVSEDVERMRAQLKTAEELIHLGWQGPAADAALWKTEKISSQWNKTASELSDALMRLSAMENLLCEQDLPLV